LDEGGRSIQKLKPIDKRGKFRTFLKSREGKKNMKGGGNSGMGSGRSPEKEAA